MSEKKKCGCFCKLLKCLLWCVAGILLLSIVAVATMPLWISPVVTGTANSLVPQYTGTDFKIERFYVNPWTGAVRINGVKLSNPEGYGESPAFSMTEFKLDLALTELFSNKLHIKDLVITDPFASYFSHDGVNNFDAILANVQKKLGEPKEKEPEEEEEAKEKSQMKVIIDHIKISGLKVKLMENDLVPPLSIPLPELNDIGKESDGASFEEVWQQLTDAFMKSMGSVGDGFSALGGLIGDGAKGLAGALSEGTKSATGALSEGTKGLTSALGSATSSAGNAAAASTGAATDAAKAATDAAGDTAKAATDAVGDTAKKATDGVKNLLKGFGK